MPLRARWRILSLRQSIDAVVEHDDVQVNISSNAVHQVVASDAKRIAISRDDKHGQVGASDFETARKGRCTTVDRVHAIGVHVVRETTGASDPRDEHQVFSCDSQFRKDFFHLCQDGVVAASWAPTNVLVTAKIGGFEYRESGVHGRFISAARIEKTWNRGIESS